MNQFVAEIDGLPSLGNLGQVFGWNPQTKAFSYNLPVLVGPFAGSCQQNVINTGGNGSAVPVCLSLADLFATGYAAGGGTAQAQTATPANPATALQPGLIANWLPANANSGGGPTLAWSGLTAKTITKCGTTALVANDLLTTAVALAAYDGTRWQLLNPQAFGCGVPAPISQPYAVSIGGTGAATQALAATHIFPAASEPGDIPICTVFSTSNVFELGNR